MNHTALLALAEHEPLSLVPWTLWVHGTLGGIAAWILIPLGIGLARIRSPRHRLVQTTAVVTLIVAVVFALVTGMPESDSEHDNSHQKRHLAGVHGEHHHAVLHTMLGMGLSVGILGQLVLGHALGWQRRGDEGRAFMAALHHIVGSILGLLLFFVQPTLGIVALFQLCTFSGTDQCVGHFGPAAGFVAAALAYDVLGTHWPAMSHMRVIETGSINPVASVPRDRHYALFAAEYGAMGGIAMVSVLYSVYSEWPYATEASQHHIGLSLALVTMSVATLAHLRRLHARTAAIPAYIQRGVPICVVAVVSGIVFAVHPQMTEYGHATHGVFGGIIAGIGVARLVWAWRTMSGLFWISAITFISSQRGFQILYAAHYHKHVSLAGALFIDGTIGATFFVLTHWWLRNFRRRCDSTLPNFTSSSHLPSSKKAANVMPMTYRPVSHSYKTTDLNQRIDSLVQE